MKITLVILVLFLMACGESSSPEGRMRLKNNELQMEITTLRKQQDSLSHRVQRLEKKIDSMGRTL